MSKDPSVIHLDSFQWGTLLRSDLGRLAVFVENFTTRPDMFGAVDATVVKQFHDHVDNMKRMAVAWGAAAMKEATQNPSSIPSTNNQNRAAPYSTSENGETESVKRGRGRPRKDANEPRVRSNPRAA